MSLTARAESTGVDDFLGHMHRCLRDALDIDYRIEVHSPLPTRVWLAKHQVGPLQVVDVSGGPCRLIREADRSRDSVFIAVPLEGVVNYREGDAKARLEPGSICLCRARRAAEIEWPAAFHTAIVAVAETRLSEVCPHWASLAAAPIAADSGAAVIFVDTLRSMLRHPAALQGSAGAGIGESLLGLLGTALGQLVQQEEGDDSRLEAYHKARIYKFIRAELGNPDLDIPLIANAAGLSQRYVHRLFTNEPLHLMQWVWAQRLENCYRELAQNRNPKRSVSAIAYAWGFNDPAHFSRTFRKRYGLTPSDLRQQTRRPDERAEGSRQDTLDQATFQS